MVDVSSIILSISKPSDRSTFINPENLCCDMQVDRHLIENVAKASRLKLSEEEIEEFLPQLKEILKAFSDIQEADTEDVLPSYHCVSIRPHMREDVPKKGMTQKQALSSGFHKDGYIKGPRVI